MVGWTAGSDQKEMKVTTDRGQRLIADRAQLAAGPLIGYGANLLSHCVRRPVQSGPIIGRNADVMLKASIPAGKRHSKKQPGDHCIPLMRYDDERSYPALLPARHRVQIAEQYVTAVQELYSGYSSAAVAARSPRSAEVHSAASAW